MSDLFDDELLGVIVHWQDAHPRDTVWFIDYGSVVLAMAYPVAQVWPLTRPRAIRRYFPEESRLLDGEDDEGEFLETLQKLSDWAQAKPEFANLESSGVKQAVVFQVEEDGFDYSIFEFRTLH